MTCVVSMAHFGAHSGGAWLPSKTPSLIAAYVIQGWLAYGLPSGSTDTFSVVESSVTPARRTSPFLSRKVKIGRVEISRQARSPILLVFRPLAQGEFTVLRPIL
jgi:hypothetical protein